MKTYTTKEYVAKLDKLIGAFSFNNKEVYEEFVEAHKDYVNRIFISGRNSSLQKIGTYSTKTMLAGRSAFVGLY